MKQEAPTSISRSSPPQRAANQIKILRKCYLASAEKEGYISVRSEDVKVSNDKVKIARRQYRGQGKYVEEILL